MRIFAILALVLGGPSAADAQDPTSPPTARSEGARRPVEGEALRLLLRDAYVARALSPGVITSPDGEVFRSDGFYRRILSRSSIEGRFVIQGHLVCVEGPDLGRRCRRVFDDGDDTYIFVDAADGSSIVMHVTYPPM